MGEQRRGSRRSDRKRENSFADEASADDLYRMCSERPRRQLLDHLLDADETAVTLPEAARAVAAGEFDETDSTATRSVDDDVLVELHHRHLPLLDDAGLVAYDPEDRTVALETLDSSTRERIEDLVGSDDDPWTT